MGESMTTPIVERHYILSGSTKNLNGVAQEIDRMLYERVIQRVRVLGKSYERSLGQVRDETQYYTFTGSNVFLNNGLVQVGNAHTTDNMSGFGMIRMFANSVGEMSALEVECALRVPMLEHHSERRLDVKA